MRCVLRSTTYSVWDVYWELLPTVYDMCTHIYYLQCMTCVLISTTYSVWNVYWYLLLTEYDMCTECRLSTECHWSQYQLISVNYKLVMLVNCVHVRLPRQSRWKPVGGAEGWDTQIQIQVEWAARLASRDLPTAQATHMQAHGQVYGVWTAVRWWHNSETSKQVTSFVENGDLRVFAQRSRKVGERWVLRLHTGHRSWVEQTVQPTKQPRRPRLSTWRIKIPFIRKKSLHLKLTKKLSWRSHFRYLTKNFFSKLWRSPAIVR